MSNWGSGDLLEILALVCASRDQSRQSRDAHFYNRRSHDLTKIMNEIESTIKFAIVQYRTNDPSNRPQQQAPLDADSRGTIGCDVILGQYV